MVNMTRLLRQITLRYQDRTALVNIERDRRFSYWRLHLLTNKIYNVIHSKFGLKAGEIYATILDNDDRSRNLMSSSVSIRGTSRAFPVKCGWSINLKLFMFKGIRCHYGRMEISGS